ncbi:hypothetical protein [Polyangium sp. 6x1]|uniref:hypothetical protein n=1 Tax=Polyangium sp. 6x1 TaxID=3042689 RepID=UPI002482E0C3|nr:hypothetical protein [Polyangium sp. 6x1]MDI1447279.1 hypothetical protein [Polyangium sp. 6x1]
MPEYKYAERFKSLPECPPPNNPAGGVVYRLVHNPIIEDDFLPNPEREKNKGNQHEQPPSCTAWGLSLFTTAAALQKKFGKLLGKYPNLANDVGNHIAEGTLVDSHGVTTKPNKEHHLNLFEFQGPNLAPVFRLVGPIQVVVRAQ